MGIPQDINAPGERGVATVDLDFSHLVGRQIALYSEQFPGKRMTTKVLAYAEGELLVNNAGQDGLVDTLVDRQTLIVQFPYKGQEISVRVKIKRTQAGRCYFVLGKQVVPLNQRRFDRITMVRPVSLAPLPALSSTRLDIARLRWMETDTVNFSSGGVLVSMSSFIQQNQFLLMHVELPEEHLLPGLLLAQVRHCYQAELAAFKIGVEFVIRETSTRSLPADRLQQLPSSVTSYTAKEREKLNTVVRAWMQNNQDRDQY